MGQGLGKDSPVVLTMGRANYEALIDRHGQWTRWRVAEKCSCVQPVTMQPDINCSLCGGRGETFTHQKTKTECLIIGTIDDSGIIDIGEDYLDSSLVRIYDSKGYTYKNAEKLGRYVTLNETPPIKGTYFNVIVEKSIPKYLKVAETTSKGFGFYEVDGLEVEKNSIDGIYYKAKSDIIKIGKIIDRAGIEYTTSHFRLNQFFIEPTKKINEETQEEEIIPITEPIYVEDVEYIEPFTFAILSQNLSKADEHAIVESQGDAVVSFPYNCSVANGDVLTILAGSITQKEVLSKTTIDIDVLTAFFVQDILSCSATSIDGTVRNYVNGVDFVLIGTNTIKWICEDRPYPSEPFSITYRVYPTYKVVKDIPQLRSSENQRFPKKVVVKLYASYADKVGVNIQKSNNGIRGGF